MVTNITAFIEQLINQFETVLHHKDFWFEILNDIKYDVINDQPETLVTVTLVFYNLDKSEFVSIIINSENEYSIRSGYDYNGKRDDYSITYFGIESTNFLYFEFNQALRSVNWKV